MATYTQELSKLTGADRSAASALITLFGQYGLESLASKIIGYVKEGFSGDTMTVMLQETPEYKLRFAANEARKKAGIAVLSPVEYIATERQYRQVMAQSGLPKGFYDQTSDFQKFLENDMSPSELNDRVKGWQDLAQSDQASLDSLRRLYGMSSADAAAFAMDPNRALPLIQAQQRAVSFAAAATRHGFTVDRGNAETYGGGAYDVSAQDAEKGFAAIQEVQKDTDRLAKMYGYDGYTVNEAEAEVFGGDAGAAAKRKKVASAERGAFSDSSKGSTGSASSNNY